MLLTEVTVVAARRTKEEYVCTHIHVCSRKIHMCYFKKKIYIFH